MTAGPADRMAAAAAGRGRLRASHADREHVVGTLKAAFVQGRLTKDEFDLRVGQTLASRTYAELAPLTADLPAGLIEAMQQRTPVRAHTRPPAKVVISRAGALIAPAALVAAFATDNEALFILFFVPAVISFMAWMITGTVVLRSWREKHSGGQPPRRPAQRARALGGEQDRRTGNDLTCCGVRFSRV